MNDYPDRQTITLDVAPNGGTHPFTTAIDDQQAVHSRSLRDARLVACGMQTALQGVGRYADIVVADRLTDI